MMTGPADSMLSAQSFQALGGNGLGDDEVALFE